MEGDRPAFSVSAMSLSPHGESLNTVPTSENLQQKKFTRESVAPVYPPPTGTPDGEGRMGGTRRGTRRTQREAAERLGVSVVAIR
jgi:hypothetical protein